MSELENILDDALAEFDNEEENVKTPSQSTDTNKTAPDPPVPDFDDFLKVYIPMLHTLALIHRDIRSDYLLK